ncbi:hypothetical protein EV44_g2294 [Erysiphe necator]|uniref:Uncharacterized protein n=1 Tax=Uncinula necator TaxID=52586 RepID=A0A0B1P1F6_UNCNE|nr:hypothetical protein EV44_g2294 [Erysiphe necator]
MESDADYQLLKQLAQGNNVDLDQWPDLLPRLVTRLEKIVLNEFPSPIRLSVAVLETSSPSQDHGSSRNDQPSSKETMTEDSNGTSSLPPLLLALISSINDTLLKYFSKAPPHTIQRLAELLLFPRCNYRSLSSYLLALDRVVHVTSTSTAFPLLLISPDSSANKSLSNGDTIDGADLHPVSRNFTAPNNPLIHGVGSDEALGGALLTPIPWLKKSRSSSPLESEVVTQRSTEIIEGPNGPGGVETVSVSINGLI